MPELPEVETMVRGIRPSVQGTVISDVRRCRCACKPISVTPPFPKLARKLRGQTIVDVRRLAKRIVLELSTGECLAIEPRMTGLMLLSDPPGREHLRIEWRLMRPNATGSPPVSLWFWDRRGLGTVRLFTPEEFQTHLGANRLGPDALQMTAAEWKACCARTNRPIKVALLEQKWIAGIGNLYASEILHRAGIHPCRPARELSARQVGRIHRAVQEVLTEAILYEGSTLSDGTYRNALNQSGGYQNEHRVYARAGESCPSCGRGTIERIVQAQRSTFFCPRCQK